jgi:hypothetical protein
MQLDQRSEPQSQAGGISLRKCLAQELVEEKLRFEIRSRGGEFDFSYAIAQVQPLALFTGRAEKARQPPAEVRGFADVRLAIPAQEEDGGRGRDVLKETLILIGREREYAGGHTLILEVIDQFSEEVNEIPVKGNLHRR